MIGQTFSHYRILGVLGAGGMGVVYLAEDQRLGRQVALKFLPADSVRDQQALDRFRLEARTASSLSHHGICAIYDIGVHDEAPYIVMELLKGETLRERVARGPLKIADVVDIGIQLADALNAAHVQGIVHRDIKPANIFVGDKLRVKILDFGLAKLAREHSLLSTGAAADVTAPGGPRLDNQLTAPGTAIGTVSYMSPEQARGEDVDARTDIFSLGVVLYEMATGRQAFSGSTSAVVFDNILNRAPISPLLLNPETPLHLVETIKTALEKDRDLRYQHAADLEADLKRIRRDLQSGATASATHTVAAVAHDPGSNARAIASAATALTTPTAPSGTQTPVAPPTPARRALWPIWAGITVVGVLAVALWSGVGRTPPTPAGSGIDVASEIRRAQLRLEAKDYRTALAEAVSALSHDPQNAEAARVKAAAEAALKLLDGLIARALQALANGDTVGAAQLLAEAQSLAPADALVIQLSARLSSAAQLRADASTPSGSRPAVDAAMSPAAPATRAPALTAPPVAARPSTPAAPRPVPAPPVAGRSTAQAAAPAETPAPVPAAVVAAPTAPPEPTPAPAPRSEPPPERRPAPPPEPTVAVPTPAPAATPTPSAPAADSDEVAIRRAVDTYERAIETKDVALFRSVRPGLSAEEERRLRASFEQVGRQQIEIRIDNIAVTGDAATVRLSRQDVVETGGRSQTSRSTQTLRLARRAAGWIIVELGR